MDQARQGTLYLICLRFPGLFVPGKFQFCSTGCGWSFRHENSKFTEAQLAFILRQAEEGTPVPKVYRKTGISDATFYDWRKKICRLMPL